MSAAYEVPRWDGAGRERFFWENFTYFPWDCCGDCGGDEKGEGEDDGGGETHGGGGLEWGVGSQVVLGEREGGFF